MGSTAPHAKQVPSTGAAVMTRFEIVSSTSSSLPEVVEASVVVVSAPPDPPVEPSASESPQAAAAGTVATVQASKILQLIGPKSAFTGPPYQNDDLVGDGVASGARLRQRPSTIATASRSRC